MKYIIQSTGAGGGGGGGKLTVGGAGVKPSGKAFPAPPGAPNDAFAEPKRLLNAEMRDGATCGTGGAIQTGGTGAMACCTAI